MITPSGRLQLQSINWKIVFLKVFFFYPRSLLHLQSLMVETSSARVRMTKAHARTRPARDTSASTRGCAASRSEVASPNASTGSSVTARFLASSLTAAGVITATPLPHHLRASVSTQSRDIWQDSRRCGAKSKMLHGSNASLCDVRAQFVVLGVLQTFFHGWVRKRCSSKQT